MKLSKSLLLAVLLLGCGTGVSAQTRPDPWEEARFRLGPLAFTPKVALTNFGIDTNVFNQPSDPKDDWTFTLVPSVDWWLRAGPLRLHVTDAVEGVYYHEFETERSINQRHAARLDLMTVKLRPFVAGTYIDAKERPGYEIDARARRIEYSGTAGLVFQIAPRTAFDLAASTATIEFDDEQFLGTSLSKTLNRDTRTASGSFRYTLTPLTTMVFSGEVMEERFVYSPVRDADSVRFTAGLDFEPFALITGSARAGWRKVEFTAGVLPEFEGFVASLNLGYTLLGRTKFGVGFSRDIQYSYDPLTPYYVLNDVNGSISQQIWGNWDLVVRGGRQKLAYRTAIEIDGSAQGRTDYVESWGGGIGYRLGEAARIGVNADYYRRRSISYNAYDGLRVGLSVTYGR